LVELAVPWFAFWPRWSRHIAGALLVIFQISLILSGNLSFLNWLTIVPALACFDDSFLRRLLPKWIVRHALRAAESARAADASERRSPTRRVDSSRQERAGSETGAPGRATRWTPQQVTACALAALIGVLSIAPVLNMLSPQQIMNTSFNRLHLVNTYGAFGSVGKVRYEIVFEGTEDSVIGDQTCWKEYEFKAKPGHPGRRPAIIAPYQPRIDWQIWFAAMSTPDQYPWTLHFVWKLLHNDAGALSLLANNPFPDKPPRFIRAQYYRYQFAPPGDPTREWWKRTLIGSWLPPLSADDTRLLRLLESFDWLPENHK
jgi:hypothetical protein